jgi:hypothetical protein
VTIRLVTLSALASVARLIARDFLANWHTDRTSSLRWTREGAGCRRSRQRLRAGCVQIESATCSQSLVSTHDLIAKIVPIFADHALDAVAKFKSHGCEQHLYITSALPWLIFTASAPHSAASAAE